MNITDTRYAKKVLIVDDEPQIVRVLKLKLENAGYEVLTAVNGIDGLEQFVKKKPGIVITDINMPYIDGRELCNMIETREDKDPYFVIVMTSSVDDALHRWAKEMSNIHFIEKPFSPAHILNVINEYFSKLHEEKSIR